MTTLHFVALFCISLQSYYFPAIGMSPLPVVGAGALTLLGLHAQNYRVALRPRLLFAVLLLAALFLYLFVIDAVVRRTLNSGVASAAVATLALFGTYQVLSQANHRAAFITGLRCVLFAHLLAWGTQAAYWAVTGSYLDLLAPVTGEAQRVWSAKGAELSGMRVPRFAGLFSEPGTYSVWMFTLFVTYHQLSGRLDRLGQAVLASMLLSFSLFGFVLVSGFLAVWLAVRREIAGLIAATVVSIIGGVLVWPVIRLRVAGEYSGLQMRQEFLDVVLDPANLALGVNSTDSLPMAYNDLGVVVYLLAYGGLIAVTIFALIMVFLMRGRGYAAAALAALVLMTKIKLSYPLLWVYLGAVYASTLRPSAISVSNVGNQQ